MTMEIKMKTNPFEVITIIIFLGGLLYTLLCTKKQKNKDNNKSLMKKVSITTYKNKYVGVTYPSFLGRWPLIWLWRKFMCPQHKHLLDEVWSPGHVEGFHEHYLCCDACQKITIVIEKVEVEQREKCY